MLTQSDNQKCLFQEWSQGHHESTGWTGKTVPIKCYYAAAMPPMCELGWVKGHGEGSVHGEQHKCAMRKRGVHRG